MNVRLTRPCGCATVGSSCLLWQLCASLPFASLGAVSYHQWALQLPERAFKLNPRAEAAALLQALLKITPSGLEATPVRARRNAAHALSSAAAERVFKADVVLLRWSACWQVLHAMRRAMRRDAAKVLWCAGAAAATVGKAEGGGLAEAMDEAADEVAGEAPASSEEEMVSLLLAESRERLSRQCEHVCRHEPADKAAQLARGPYCSAVPLRHGECVGRRWEPPLPSAELLHALRASGSSAVPALSTVSPFCTQRPAAQRWELMHVA